MKTISDLENMKSRPSTILGNAYEFLIGQLEDYYISKSDGKERIVNELKNWDKETQTIIVNTLVERISRSMINFEADDLLSLVK